MSSASKFLVFAGLAAIAGGLFARTPDPRPNVLFIASDDLRDWVGYMGASNQSLTPNLDRLAAMGVAFKRAYCASPSCNPSRAALFSGLRPSTSGVYENNVDFRKYLPPSIMLPTAFRNAGYYVQGAGKMYHESFRRSSDWDDYLELGNSSPPLPPAQSPGVGGIEFAPLDCKDSDLPDWTIVNYGIASLQTKHDRPFFLAVGLHKPHMPWNVPRRYFELFPLDSLKLPPYLANDLDDIPESGRRMAETFGDHAAMVKSGRWREAVQAYLATIAYMDMNLGRLLDAFEKSPYRDNTIIVFWSDHGWHLGEKNHWRKFALWEAATRTPLIWKVPGVTKPGGVSMQPVDLMSIYPTLTELCGIPTPKHVEGTDIRALLENPRAKWDIPAVTTYRRGNHAVRSAQWRYIRYANGDEELYDEAADPDEYVNLAARPEFAGEKSRLAAFFPKTNAPTPPSDRSPANKKKPAPGAKAQKHIPTP